jgi:endonuclease III-like uncharacterized protein
MWVSIFLNIFISIIIIYIGHQLWIYLRDKYSTKITKDLLASQTKKYKEIAEIINQSNPQNNETKNIEQPIDSQQMETELESFIETI